MRFYFIILIILYSCDLKKEPGKMLELLPPEETGIYFSNIIEEDLNNNIFTYTNYYNGGGVAVGDINNDGWIDIYLSANSNSGKLYLNEGNFSFKDITHGSGLDTISGWKTGVTMVDINQDGFLDIYICRSGRTKPRLRSNLLYINNGNLTFSEKAGEYGLDDWSTSTQAAFFDYDLDGDLDMYLLNHAIEPVREIFKGFNDDDINNNTGDKLFRNDNNRFIEVKEFIGIKKTKLGDGLGLVIGHFNDDVYPDIYVCNDFAGRDYFYLNNGDGTFRETGREAMMHISYSSMGADAADIDNDGLMDIMVLDMHGSNNYRRKTNMTPMESDIFSLLGNLLGQNQYMRNTLQLNNGNETFSDIASMAGVTSTDWSWAPLFVDIDNDGKKDLFVTNGMNKNVNNNDYDNYRNILMKSELKKSAPDYERLMWELLDKIPGEKVPNYVYKNTNGLKFVSMNKNWGIEVPSYSNGVAYGDLDNDGDMDLIVNNIDDYAHIYRNNAASIVNNNYLKIKLLGKRPNLSGIGARVIIVAGKERQTLEQFVARGFQSSVDFVLNFGVGKKDTIKSLKVIWPDGSISERYNIRANQMITVSQEHAHPAEAPDKQHPIGIFTDVTQLYGIHHKHIENEGDDYNKQILLHLSHTAFGPAVAVGDINSDGLDDFFVGGASGYEGCIYIQKKDTAFVKSNQKAFFADRMHEDVDAVFFDADLDGDLDLYVVSGGSEFPPDSYLYQDRLYINNGEGIFNRHPSALPEFLTSGGVVRAGDFDSDGDQDLFVGGRVIPGSYPMPPRSYILGNDNGHFRDITDDVAVDLNKPGLVTDAQWTDFNSDGKMDLIIVGEWMSPGLYQNEGNKLKKIYGDSVLENSTGWWCSVLEADVDADGDPDYILGNIGENNEYIASTNSPMLLYSNDFDNNGELDIVLAYYEDSTLYPVEGRDHSILQVPGLKKKFPDWHTFGQATLDSIYGSDALKTSRRFNAKTFSSGILVNNTDHFDLKFLPQYAQISAVFGLLYADFDQDGHNDIVIAGNYYNTNFKTVRMDAGQGLFLKGNGNGKFIAVRGYDSGLYLKGDVKKLKMIRLGPDKRMGMVAGVNNDFIKLIKAL